jgi:hypothetical protein
MDLASMESRAGFESKDSRAAVSSKESRARWLPLSAEVRPGVKCLSLSPDSPEAGEELSRGVATVSSSWKEGDRADTSSADFLDGLSVSKGRLSAECGAELGRSSSFAGGTCSSCPSSDRPSSRKSKGLGSLFPVRILSSPVGEGSGETSRRGTSSGSTASSSFFGASSSFGGSAGANEDIMEEKKSSVVFEKAAKPAAALAAMSAALAAPSGSSVDGELFVAADPDPMHDLFDDTHKRIQCVKQDFIGNAALGLTGSTRLGAQHIVDARLDSRGRRLQESPERRRSIFRESETRPERHGRVPAVRITEFEVELDFH